MSPTQGRGRAPERVCLCKPGGDPGWREVHAELLPLHVAKSGTYGTTAEPFQNYVETSEAFGEPDEWTPAVRIREKLARAIALLRDGRADEIKDWPDIAALAIGAEALRRRRL